MNLADLTQINLLAAQLTALDAKINKANSAEVFINGVQIPDDLMALLLTAGLPIVQRYFAAQRQGIVDQLTSLGVTVS